MFKKWVIKYVTILINCHLLDNLDSVCVCVCVISSNFTELTTSIWFSSNYKYDLKPISTREHKLNILKKISLIHILLKENMTSSFCNENAWNYIYIYIYIRYFLCQIQKYLLRYEVVSMLCVPTGDDVLVVMLFKSRISNCFSFWKQNNFINLYRLN